MIRKPLTEFYYFRDSFLEEEKHDKAVSEAKSIEFSNQI